MQPDEQGEEDEYIDTEEKPVEEESIRDDADADAETAPLDADLDNGLSAEEHAARFDASTMPSDPDVADSHVARLAEITARLDAVIARLGDLYAHLTTHWREPVDPVPAPVVAEKPARRKPGPKPGFRRTSAKPGRKPTKKGR